MKILMTADTVGGVWTYALELARALAVRRVEVVLATMGAPLRPDQQTEAARLPNVTLHESAYRLEWMQEAWDDVAWAGVWLQKIASRTRPDVIHLNNYVHAPLPWPASPTSPVGAAGTRPPVLVVGHSCVLSWHRAARGRDAGPEWERYRGAVARGLQAADAVVAPTRTMLDWLDELYGPLPPRRTIPNARNAAAYRAGSKEPFVLAAGRLWDEAKSFGLLARAAGRIDWPVVVAGDASHPDGGAAEFDGVTLLGRLAADEMADWFARAAIYALPARYEPFGLSPLEAAHSGCALVLGDIPTLREVWGDAAWFVPPGDDGALAAAINTLAADPRRRQRLAARAAARARQFTPERMAAEYVDLYRALRHAANGGRLINEG